MDIKVFRDGGMNLDDAPQDIAPNDYIEAYNFNNSGTSDSEEGDVTDIEAMSPIPFTLPDGINKTIGSASFPSIRNVIDFTYNSDGFHSINEYDYDTQIRRKLFINKTDSNGIDVLVLDPLVYVKDIKLLDDNFVFFLPSNRQPSIFNLERLRNGGYGTVRPDDFKLIKKQPPYPIKMTYGDDAGVSSNLLAGKIIKARYQYIYLDNEPSAWSTYGISPVPDGTQSSQTDVTKDNNLTFSLDIGNDRVKEIRIAVLINESTVWKEIKTIKREDIIAIVDDEIDIPLGVLEAYSSVDNEYMFVFYNNGAYSSVDVLESDLPYDYVPLTSEAAELANGNVLLLANNKEGYDFPASKASVDVSYEASGITSVNNNSNAIYVDRFIVQRPDNPRALLRVYYGGLGRTGDILTVRTRNVGTGEITTFQYLVPSIHNENMEAILNIFGVQQFTLGFNVYFENGLWILQFRGRTDHRPLDASVIVADSSSATFDSKRSIKLNSSYQPVLLHSDNEGRWFPAIKSNQVDTLHFGATQGNIPVFNWSITGAPPLGARYYQWGLSYNLTHQTWLYVNGTLLIDEGAWDAAANNPVLSNTSGQLAHFYTVAKNGSRDLGNGTVDYGLGDIVIYNGLTYVRIPYSERTTPGAILSIKNNDDFITIYMSSLNRFNNASSSSILNYEFSVGDRMTIHYSKDGSNTNYFSNPAIDVEVVGYDPALNIIKARKPQNFNISAQQGKELLFEIYTPKTLVDADSNVFYEVGPVYDIIDGEYTQRTGQIREADSFIKTRNYYNATDYDELDIYLLEDANYSDYFISNYYPYGRPHTFQSLAKQVTNKADIRYSDVLNRSNNTNMLNRFYGERVVTYDYTKGGIKFIIQRGNIVVCLQEIEYCYIPIEISILEDQAAQQNVSISDKLLNKARYPENNQAGIGNATESLAYHKGNIYFVDPLRSEPCRIGYNGLTYLSYKLSKFFKRNIQNNYKNGLKHIGWINEFEEKYILSVETRGDIVSEVAFSLDNWKTEDTYQLPQVYTVDSEINGEATITGNQMVFTPDNDFVGEGGVIVSFSDTKKICIDVEAGQVTPEPFFFIDLTDQDMNTLIVSNAVIISGIDIDVPISVVGGEYEKNLSGTWTSSDGLVSPDDTVRVRQMSSSFGETSTDAVLTVGGVSDTFSVTTRQGVDTFDLGEVIDAPISSTETSDVVTISGLPFAKPVVLTANPAYMTKIFINGSEVPSGTNISNGNTLSLSMVSSASYETQQSVSVDINNYEATWSVTTQAAPPAKTITSSVAFPAAIVDGEVVSPPEFPLEFEESAFLTDGTTLYPAYLLGWFGLTLSSGYKGSDLVIYEGSPLVGFNFTDTADVLSVFADSTSADFDYTFVNNQSTEAKALYNSSFFNLPDSAPYTLDANTGNSVDNEGYVTIGFASQALPSITLNQSLAGKIDVVRTLTADEIIAVGTGYTHYCAVRIPEATWNALTTELILTLEG